MQCKKNNVNSIVAIVAFQYRLFFFVIYLFSFVFFVVICFINFYVRFSFSFNGTASIVFVYLFLGSLLYVPPYLLLWAASSVISGIQLANTA